MAVGLILFTGMFFISAQDGEITLRCCVETENGVCQELTSEESDDLCQGQVFSVECNELTNECSSGCCISSRGVCTPNSPRGTCGEGGIFNLDDASCSIAQCEEGCCILKDGPELMTDQECIFLSGIDSK